MGRWPRVTLPLSSGPKELTSTKRAMGKTNVRIRLVVMLLGFCWAVGCEALISGDLAAVHCEALGTIGPPACPIGSMCTEGLCVPTKLGSVCDADGDCTAPEFCVDPASYGLAGPRRCSRTCCTSSDCDPNNNDVCWLDPVGAQGYCVSAALVDRKVVGCSRAWAPCRADADCRSSVCISGYCIDTCCSNTSCVAQGGTCQYLDPAPVDAGQPGFYCGASDAQATTPYAACSLDTDCASGLCVEFPTSLLIDAPGKRCTLPCCASTDCSTVSGVPDMDMVCAELIHNGSSVRACSPTIGVYGSGQVGTTCLQGSDCRSGRCVGMNGGLRCTDACCVDENCGDSSFACRPSTSGLECLLRSD